VAATLRRVLFLDDDVDLRDIASELFASANVECTAVPTLAALQVALARSSDDFDLAIVDINLGDGQPSGVDAYRWLRGNGFRGRIAFLTGHAKSHPLVAEALKAGDVNVYEKPIDFDVLMGLLAR
jgi:DNA-binding NtrC family response regulator